MASDNQTSHGIVVTAFSALTDADLVEMICRNGGLDTLDIANRFGLSAKDARRRLRSIEATGAIRGKAGSYKLGKGGGSTLKWEAL
jgi:DNA-binding Lrp family transcriptional regulator